MAGAWEAAYWPRLRGVMICAVNGAFDYHADFTDFARFARARMRELDIPHIDNEYLGPHSHAPVRRQAETLFDVIKMSKRDPYCPHVCAVSPFIPDIDEMRPRYPSQPYSFWASVIEAGPDGVPVDYAAYHKERVYENGADGDRKWGRNMLAPRRDIMKAGAVEAENLGGNRFRVKVTNAKRFQLWLHPKMGIDFAKPIEIELISMGVDLKTNAQRELGCEKVVATARPSLAAMLKYLGDRRDYGLIYHAAVELVAADGERK
jgi:hypothetical protein